MATKRNTANLTCLPQNLENLPYYHRRLNRFDVQDVLSENGDFILRKTKVANVERFVVSVRWQNELRHFPIQTTSNGRYAFEHRAFKMIRDLIKWHRDHHTPITEESGALLKFGKPLMKWELLTPQLQESEDTIAEGRYGIVFEGVLMARRDGTDTRVAVKSVEPGEISDQLFEQGCESILHEARCLRELGDHANIVKFLGITIDQRWISMATELMSGNLAESLSLKLPISMDSKTTLAKSVIAALAYIHCHDMVHRNICAKNCLIIVKSNGAINLKLTGFDFCEKLDPTDGVFKDKSMPPLNMAVCAPETLVDKTWSKSSDIWSFAVFEYELFTNGAQPYGQEFAKTKPTLKADFLLRMLQNGIRLILPENTPQTVKEKWTSCMQMDFNRRPTAFEILDHMP